MKNILPRENGRCSNQLVSLFFTSASFSNSLMQAISIALASSATRSLNLSSQFKLGCAVLVAALNSVLNPTLFNYAHISNNKRFKCVRKLTGSLLRSARLSGALENKIYEH